MQPYTSRGEAKIKGLTQYFTGVPCKNGHTTYRYTASGACSGCIRAANSKVVDESATEKRAAKAELVQARFRIFDVDRATFSVTAWAMAAMRYPALTQGDVDPHLLGKEREAGTGMYAYYCHPDDLSTLRGVAMDMVKARMSLNAKEARERAIEVANRYSEPDTAPPMSFK